MRATKPNTIGQHRPHIVKKSSGNDVKQSNQKAQIVQNQLSNFEQHKAIKILQREVHIQSIEQRTFLASYLRRHVEQFRELEGDAMEFLMNLTLNLKYVFYPKGKVIFHENENKDDLFFILDGDVQFYTRKTEQDIQTEQFWLQQVQSKIKNTNGLSQKEHQRLLNDEQVLHYYKSQEDEALFKHSKKKNLYFLNGVLLFKKTYQRIKAETFGINEKDNSQTAVAQTDLILAVTSQTDYVQSYAKYKEKNQFAFECLKKNIAAYVSQQPTRIDDKTLREIASKTVSQYFPAYSRIIKEVPEQMMKEIPYLSNANKSELELNESVFIIKSGIVEYYQNYIDSEQRGIKILQLNEGEIFGNECFLLAERQKYTAITCSKETQILQLKKIDISENQTLYNILLQKGSDFYRKLQLSLNKPKKIIISQQGSVINPNGQKYYSITKNVQNSTMQEKNKSDHGNLPSSLKGMRVSLQIKINQEVHSSSTMSSSSKNLINNKILKQTSQQQSASQLQTNLKSNQSLLSNQKQLDSSHLRLHPKSQQVTKSMQDIRVHQIKSNTTFSVNDQQNSQKKDSNRKQQDEFQGSFFYLDDEESNNDQLRSRSKESNKKLEIEIDKLKQKNRIIISARSCTQIQEETVSPLKQNMQHQQSISPFLQVPSSSLSQQSVITSAQPLYSTVHSSRKSMSTYTSPLSEIIFQVKDRNDNNDQQKLIRIKSNNKKDVQERVEELKLSPTKLRSMDVDQISDIKQFLKQQRNAKIPPCRQPEEFRIKFNSTTQTQLVNNGIDEEHNDEEPQRNSKTMSVLYLSDSEKQQQRHKLNINQLVDQQSIEYNYQFSGEIHDNIKETNQILTNQQANRPTSYNLQRQINTQLKFSEKQYLNPKKPSPIRSIDKIHSPSQIHYMNFKQKHLQLQNQITSFKLQAN